MKKHFDVPTAGFTVNDWCTAAGFGRTTEWALPPELKPRSIRIGTRRIIIEPPAEYHARIFAMQNAAVPA